MSTPIEPNPSRWSPSTDPASIAVPGVDTSAPINDQIDQIEQLITIKLQNIDANFSRIQHLMATRLLPAVKRYAVGTEAVREAAKFWTSFYEQAAQVHIPTLDDDDDGEFAHEAEQTQTELSAVAPASVSEREEDADATTTLSRAPSDAASRAYDVTASESSFMPAHAAVSSTPARPGRASDHTMDEQPSWNASLDLPMARLKNELQNFAREEAEGESVQLDASSVTDSIMYEEEDTVQQFPAGEKGKSAPRVDPEESIAPAVPPSALPTPRANVTGAHVPPLKVKPKTPVAIPKHIHIQSFLPAKLGNEPVFASPRRPRYERTPRKHTADSSTSTSRSASASSMLDIPSLTKQAADANTEPGFPEFNDSFDDSVDLMMGMSPPRTLAFARAPRSSVGLGLLPPLGRTPGKDKLPTLGRTPGKEAADRIRRDLLGDMQTQFGPVNSAVENKLRTPAFGYGSSAAKDDTMSTIPTPPSLSRYTRNLHPSWTDNNDTDTSLATMMRRVGLEMPGSSYQADSVVSGTHSRASSRTDAGSNLQTPDHQDRDTFDFHHDDQSTIQLGSHPHADSDSDSGSGSGSAPASDSDSDSDSLIDEPIRMSHPSTAFIMASSRAPDPDDSFGSSNSNHSMDSLGEGEFGGGDEAAVHPFARALDAGDGDGFDDSFDSEGGYEEGQSDHCSAVTEETVFGIPPARRGEQGRAPGELKLLGEGLLQDTIGIGGQLAKTGRVEESPTPYGR